MAGCWPGNTIRYRDARSELTTCMIIANQKPIRIIGYRNSSMTHEFTNAISKTHQPIVLEPSEYFDLSDKQQYQYIVASWKDCQERKHIIDSVNDFGVDLVTYVDDTVQLGSIPPCEIGPGTFVFPFCSLSIGCNIGRHCIIASHSHIGHYCELGQGCILRPGVIIVGKSKIGNHCIFNLRSTVSDQAVICDHVVVMGFSAVTKTISQTGRYIGTPARLIKN